MIYPQPKDPPIINDKLLRFMVEKAIARCEWPRPHDCTHRLQAAHIRARGMGGGRRKDVPENVAVLCDYTHAHFDNFMGQSVEHQQWLKTNVLKRRKPYEVAALEGFGT